MGFIRPALQDHQEKVTLNASIRQLELDLNIARNLALQSNFLYRVILNIGSNDYAIYQQHATQNSWLLYKNNRFEVDGITIPTSDLSHAQVVFSHTAEAF